ncbi:MAG TPA: hypothetical protein DEV93_10130 [Chloroflexi bacterium]|jgi:hypothetical protein|nr:hypothetical protein [Chloroflexota bacterium]
MDEERDRLRAEARRLANESRTEIRPFRDLVHVLLANSVMDAHYAGPAVYYAQGTRDRGDLGGLGRVLAPVPLRDGRWLRLAISLYVENTEHGRRLKAAQSSFQYQVSADPHADDWIFRYDYLRDPRDRYPAAHLQINADLKAPGVLAEQRPLARVHFPTGRVPLEAVIRLLAEDFGVPCGPLPEVWRAMLAEAESVFKEIAHQPPFGPAA